jgi:hypothetical protein
MWKEVVVTHFTIIFQPLSGKTEVNYDIAQYIAAISMNTDSYKPTPDIETEHPAGGIRLYDLLVIYRTVRQQSNVMCYCKIGLFLICFNLIYWSFHILYCIQLYVMVLLLLLLLLLLCL